MQRIWLTVPLWFVVLIFDLGFTVIACLLAPVLPLFAQANGYLPNGLSWFQTADNSLDGDAGWQDPAERPLVNRLPRYLRRVLWLWRNPAYGWSCTVTNRVVPAGVAPACYGNPLVSNRPYTPGWRRLVAAGTWELYFVGPSLFGRCVRIRLGWKVGNLIGSSAGGSCQFVCSPNPLMGRADHA